MFYLLSSIFPYKLLKNLEKQLSVTYKAKTDEQKPDQFFDD